MKNIVRLTMCLIMGLTFVFSTMLQFHHHDSAGNIFLYLTGVGEIELSSHHHPHDKPCCGHVHHDHDDSSHNESEPTESECAMHLDETIVVDDHINGITLKTPGYILLYAVLNDPICVKTNVNDESAVVDISQIVVELTGFSDPLSRRGPPLLS